MVNVRELRIGNLLVDSKGRLCKVEKIYEDTFKAYAIEGALTTGATGPIPLTEKILLKCGFEKIENNWKVLDLIFVKISWERLAGLALTFNAESIYLPHIKYLHQLQNLIHALTGEELIYTP